MIRATLILLFFCAFFIACDGEPSAEVPTALKTEKIPLFREWIYLFSEREIPLSENLNTGDQTISTGLEGAEAILRDLGGIPFPKGASAIYDGQFLIVRNTPENLESIHALLDTFFQIPHLGRQLERSMKSLDRGSAEETLRDSRAGYLEAHAMAGFYMELLTRKHDLDALQTEDPTHDSATIEKLTSEIELTEIFLSRSQAAYRESLKKQLELCLEWQEQVYGKVRSEAVSADLPDLRADLAEIQKSAARLQDEFDSPKSRLFRDIDTAKKGHESIRAMQAADIALLEKSLEKEVQLLTEAQADMSTWDVNIDSNSAMRKEMIKIIDENKELRSEVERLKKNQP